MRYLFLMIVKIPGYDYYIELCKDYELEFHPNLTDLIFVDECFCEIKEIRLDIDSNTNWLKLEKVDDLFRVEEGKDNEAIECLVSEIEEFKAYDWYLNNYDLGDWKPTLPEQSGK